MNSAARESCHETVGRRPAATRAGSTRAPEIASTSLQPVMLTGRVRCTSTPDWLTNLAPAV